MPNRRSRKKEAGIPAIDPFEVHGNTANQKAAQGS